MNLRAPVEKLEIRRSVGASLRDDGVYERPARR
jgi:hypothetical protein